VSIAHTDEILDEIASRVTRAAERVVVESSLTAA
jgi:hypothetical protein